jgi:hypothetical protein
LLLLGLPALAAAQFESDRIGPTAISARLANQRVQHYAAIVHSTNKLLEAYARLSEPRQKRLAFVVVPSAQIRRAALAWLIEHAPERAIELSLSPVQRAGLPQYIVDLLERRIHATGDLEQSFAETLPIGGDSQKPPSEPQTGWTAVIGQETFQAYVYGIRSQHHTKYETPIHGIAIDSLFAVDEDPLYELDELEIIQYGYQPGSIVALIGNGLITFPDFVALQKQREALIDVILRFDPRPLEIKPWTTGPKEMLVVRADFTDATDIPYTDAEILGIVAEVSSFFEQNSGGQTLIRATILPETIHLDSATTEYSRYTDHRLGLQAVKNAAYPALLDHVGDAGSPYHPNRFDRILVLTPRVYSGDDDAYGQIGGKMLVNAGGGLDLPTLAHEVGHTWGFLHSGFWIVGYDESPISPTGANDDYGDLWDMMGAERAGVSDADPYKRHFNGYFKYRAGWLPVTDFVDATAGGTYRLFAHDIYSVTPGPRAIRIDAGGGLSYWLDARRRFGFDENQAMFQGIEVRRVRPYLDGQLVELLDMKPREGTTLTHSLTLGPATVLDAANGITLRIENYSATYADVIITRD